MRLQPHIDAFRALPPGVAQAEAHLEAQAQKRVAVRDGQAISTEFFDRSALYVRATGASDTGAATGLTYTENLAEEPVAVMRRAVENARVISATDAVTFTPPGLTYADDPRGPLTPPTLAELTRAAAGLEQAARSFCEDARLASCSLTYTRYVDEVANSLGLAVESACGYYTLECHILSERNGSQGEKKLKLLSDSPDGFNLEPAARDAARTARLLAGTAPIRAGAQPVILAADAACDFLFMLWRAMSAGQNRQSGAAFAGREGQQVAAAGVTLVSSATHPGCPIRYRFDNEGMPVARTRLVDRGVFRSLMSNRGTAGQTGGASTGNAGRRVTMSGVIQAAVQVTPKVLTIEAGEARRDEMLRQMGDGLIVEEILDSFHGIDYASGAFSVPVTCAVVSGGERQPGSRTLVWTGNLAAALNGVAAVGVEMRFSCFRDSYTLGAPDILIQDQSFAGAGGA